jgi:hypothetical protein
MSQQLPSRFHWCTTFGCLRRSWQWPPGRFGNIRARLHHGLILLEPVLQGSSYMRHLFLEAELISGPQARMR